MELKNSLTDKEKLEKIKKIIENNLYPVFTSFALDLNDGCSKGNKLEYYVELKELLNIKHGITMQPAIDYDKFKETQKDLYDILITRLEDRMIELRDKHYFDRLSAKMFMSAIYPIYAHKLSINMTIKDFDKMIDGINKYEFIGG